MLPFLYRIAQAFYAKYPHNISDFTFVFPNRRAGLFFRKYLMEFIDKPIFSPDISTINDIFLGATNWREADRINLLFRLYRIFGKISKRTETFDTFAGWGEMLLNDFDDVDKYLVDVEQIFTNVTKLKEIDNLFNPFSEKQVKALQQFWEHFIPVAEGKTQEDFISVWRVLLPVYKQFRKELLSEGLATEAMIFRSVAERLRSNNPPELFAGKKYVFIGFNALNPCEDILFEWLKKNTQADFYWDFESEEIRDEENLSSEFIKRNSKKYKSEISITPSYVVTGNKKFELFSVPSAAGQAKETCRLLDKLYPAASQNRHWMETAIVLPDENLLLPMLHSIPPQIEKINVTMGFPLKTTPISGFLEHLFDLQKRTRKTSNGVLFYFQTVQNILHHSYVQLLCKEETETISEKIISENKIFVESEMFDKNSLLSLIFTPCLHSANFVEYLNAVLKRLYVDISEVSAVSSSHRLECDFLYQYYLILNRLNDAMRTESDPIEISLDTIIRIVRQTILGISIPFEGEPLEGLQIMGALETRCLDFKNLIICSFNENIFPKRNFPNSFIPYHLRKAFELSTSENQDATWAYNFYRLLQRAERVFFLYDSRTENGQTGEVSRFVHQLQYHYGVHFDVKNTAYDVRFTEATSIVVPKTDKVMERLQHFVSGNVHSKSLSASTLNSYIDCPLKFYFSKIEGLEEIEEVTENVEASMFGTLLHKVMQDIYEPYENKTVNGNDLDEISKNRIYIETLIRKAFAKEYFRKQDTDITLEGNYLLVAKVIEKYVRQILKYDKSKTPFTYLASEKTESIDIPLFNGKFSVQIKGIIDRAEEKEGIVHVIDYKSGGGDLNFKGLDEVFEHDNDKRPKYVLQTFLYSLLFKKQTDDRVIVPQIYYVRNVFKDKFDTDIIQKPERNVALRVENFANYETDFTEMLTTLIEEIYNPENPFYQCKSVKPCEYCSFKIICRR
ncbi:MAG: PD-(D/E)XK nuclease family protein [Paludibacteraceae bacterium]